MSSQPDIAPSLLADLGGTHARFALLNGRTTATYSERTYASADYPNLAEAIRAYLSEIGSPRPVAGAIAVATSVTSDWVSFTNSPWAFSLQELQGELGLRRLEVLNDFTALALAIPYLKAHEQRRIGPGHTQPNAPIGVIGPGTGLGVSGLIPGASDWIPLQGEGGHATASAVTRREADLIARVARRFEHVSFERLVSGPGLSNLYRAAAEIQGTRALELTPEVISRRAQIGDCPLCSEALEDFCGFLGIAAGNLALTLGALGGVYIGGGIVTQLGPIFERSAFRSRFEGKGRFRDYLRAIPTFVIQAPNPAFRGLAYRLQTGAPGAR
jgi:glucokinase